MHDPLVVAFEIRRPWPQHHRQTPSGPQWKFGLTPFWSIAGMGLYFPTMITIWHREPGGRDSGEVCKHHSRYQDHKGDWQWKFHHGWRFHVHHWKIQVTPLQRLRRRLLTQCAWCQGRHHRRDPVCIRHGWDPPRARWWMGERGLYHQDCSMIASAHRTCVCADPIRVTSTTESARWGTCRTCGKNAPYGRTPEQMDVVRRFAVIPEGHRDPEVSRG